MKPFYNIRQKFFLFILGCIVKSVADTRVNLQFLMCASDPVIYLLHIICRYIPVTFPMDDKYRNLQFFY